MWDAPCRVTSTPAPGRRRLLALSIALLASAAGCTRTEEAPLQEDTLVVFAAASLREAFTGMEAGFERAHPGVDVTFNFAGTQELRTQIDHGAAADVLASADQRHMDALLANGRVSSPVVFARNEPVLVVARESATTIRAFADLPAARRFVIGTPEVPIGRYTLDILDRASATLGADFRSRVLARVASREMNVRQVLAKVSLGEADAGIVYRTDTIAATDGVSVVTIPPDINVIASYPIAVVEGAAHPTLARAWVRFILSAEGQGSLRRAGLLAP